MASLHCAITSPEGLIFEGEAKSVVVPAADGELGILPRHAPLVATLGSGALRIELPDGKRVRYFVDGGFLQVLRNEVTVLATEAEPLETLEASRAEARLKTLLSSALPRTATLEELDEYQEKLRVARLRLKLVS